MNLKRRSTPLSARLSLSLLAFMILSVAQAQTLSLREAVDTAMARYGIIQAKGNYVKAGEERVIQSKREYLPNLNFSAQQVYGTVNGQNGPLYGFGGLGVASSGLPLPDQNWNAAFGALYLANINWEFFSFGRAKERINVARKSLHVNETDLDQEKFQHRVRVAGAYLNLLVAQRLKRIQEKNLERAMIVKRTATARAANGLLAGVDSSLANAEVSAARIALTNADNLVREQANQLSVLTAMPTQDYALDTTFINKLPLALADSVGLQEQLHPILQYYQSRIDLSNRQVILNRKQYYPTFSFFSVYQTRASGFSSNYAVDQSAFSHNYIDGIKPTRSNYLLGIGVQWNMTTLLRTRPAIKAQEFTSKGLQEEYNQVKQQLDAQVSLADVRIKNALSNYKEVPNQLKSASDAYLQKTTLYNNGLTNIVDVTQALYALNRAETDRDVSYSNVWQALLLKAAATGNWDIFINEF
ncbi:TolC family protein [Terrimonas sp. NA20]|uniref:TolC family protein n=1 Tax=Terrimonas ginsenosidimutans TaxID=2908004 RepID=A0ABS9KZ03_9BACT|nr:TolC family protein [Terrimonas ginsenosidimutans]MCG2617462.1 TolC family protein [Terrimonas ginsenosidimutans]